MKITVVCVGKIKEKFYRDAVCEYLKRLSRYCKISIVECTDEKTPDGASDSEERQIKEKEGERILSRISDSDYCIALAIDGMSFSSEGFSSHFSDLMMHGKSSITFIIGGSLGLSDGVLRRADELLSFSRFTFPHQLMRVILLEQVYRSYRIMNNEPYHK
ncbi:MAG: 23S rRNA (pseudouridine(1915)-N(3))-methyltransferase RlmH [Lachnospiraceae bacterium]|nr:23S rRNA (pseudouridine(1915)-N(3))-methyltransferase RlmH [Lachnospiraceae bacterium]